MSDVPADVVEVFDASHLQQVLDAAEFGVGVSEAEADRLLSVADEGHRDVICTTWDGFCYDNLGETNGPNRFVVAEIDYERSSGSKAWIVDSALVVQQDWLQTDDGRKAKTQFLDMTDGNEQFDGWDEVGQGSFPKDYVFACHVDDEAL